MKKKHAFTIFFSTILALGVALGARRNPSPEFVADEVFEGSSLSDWHTLGKASWQARDGEIIGTATSGGGWLVLNKAYQDVGVYFRFRCDGNCNTGLLMRAEKTPEGMKGEFLSLAEGDLKLYHVTLDASGTELSRTPMPVAGNFARNVADDAAGRGAAAGGGRGGGGGGGRGPAGPGRSGAGLPFPLPTLNPPSSGIQKGEWNQLNITLDSRVMRASLNLTPEIPIGVTPNASGYGPIALYVGAGAVTFKDISWKDLNVRQVPAETVSSRFRMQKLDEFYYSWGSAVADINHDGILDVIAGPWYYLGPDYTTKHEYYLGHTYDVSTQFTNNMVGFASDFTGDGWADVLVTQGRPIDLMVNPHGENRRWNAYRVLPTVSNELVIFKDLNGDGKPEAIYGDRSAFYWAGPDPANPTATWPPHRISDDGLAFGHSLGAGDINGDGRLDVLGTDGWWEQAAAGPAQPWTYHPFAFGRYGRSEGAGGGEIAVYDVNGDGLNDVVTSLNAHGFGLAWYEQKRDKGTITFVQHMIMDNFSTDNTGGVTFSEMHAGASADMDGDGLPDFITGKRSFSHQESYQDADPYGAPVLYWFRTVRDPKASGGAKFVPELIHNRSGIGSQFTVADLNKDGAMDIVTSGNRGTFIFWGKPRAARAKGPTPATAKKAAPVR